MTKRRSQTAFAAIICAILSAASVAPVMACGPGMAGQSSDPAVAAHTACAPGFWGLHGYGMASGMAYGLRWGNRDWMRRGDGGVRGMMMGSSGWGPEVNGVLGLSSAQQKKIRNIQEQLGKQQWRTMQRMHARMWKVGHSYGKKDRIDAIVDARKAIFNARLQMLRDRLEAQKKIRDTLNAEQRKKLNEMERWGVGDEWGMRYNGY